MAGWALSAGLAGFMLGMVFAAGLLSDSLEADLANGYVELKHKVYFVHEVRPAPDDMEPK